MFARGRFKQFKIGSGKTKWNRVGGGTRHEQLLCFGTKIGDTAVGLKGIKKAELVVLRLFKLEL